MCAPHPHSYHTRLQMANSKGCCSDNGTEGVCGAGDEKNKRLNNEKFWSENKNRFRKHSGRNMNGGADDSIADLSFMTPSHCHFTLSHNTTFINFLWLCRSVPGKLGTFDTIASCRRN